jgi:hypothetical protein
LSCSAGSYFFSSATIALACATGSTAVVERREVDHVQQQVRALQVAQEQVAEARAFGRAFDQAGMSATTKLCSGATRTTPRFGCKVVNG